MFAFIISEVSQSITYWTTLLVDDIILHLCLHPGNSYWSGTVQLTSLCWLVQISCSSYRNNIIILCTTAYLKEEVNCTQPSLSVRVPWYIHQLQLWVFLGKETINLDNNIETKSRRDHFPEINIFRLLRCSPPAQYCTELYKCKCKCRLTICSSRVTLKVNLHE
jgi:hypothetical protein